MNPIAGGGRAARVWRSIGPRFVEHAIACSATRSPGEAIQLAREAVAHRAERVIAVGGDGTVSEIAASLVGSSTALAVIPAGSGNDFARAIGLPRKPAAAAHLALHGTPTRVDAGCATLSDAPRTFVNVAGCGFDADVVRHLAYPRGGSLAYLAAVLGTLGTSARSICASPSTVAARSSAASSASPSPTGPTTAAVCASRRAHPRRRAVRHVRRRRAQSPRRARALALALPRRPCPTIRAWSFSARAASRSPGSTPRAWAARPTASSSASCRSRLTSSLPRCGLSPAADDGRAHARRPPAAPGRDRDRPRGADLRGGRRREHRSRHVRPARYAGARHRSATAGHAARPASARCWRFRPAWSSSPPSSPASMPAGSPCPSRMLARNRVDRRIARDATPRLTLSTPPHATSSTAWPTKFGRARQAKSTSPCCSTPRAPRPRRVASCSATPTCSTTLAPIADALRHVARQPWRFLAPHFHDMGLVGGILVPLVSAVTARSCRPSPSRASHALARRHRTRPRQRQRRTELRLRPVRRPHHPRRAPCARSLELGGGVRRRRAGPRRHARALRDGVCAERLPTQRPLSVLWPR